MMRAACPWPTDTCANRCSAEASARLPPPAVISSILITPPTSASPPSPACATAKPLSETLRRGELYLRQTKDPDAPEDAFHGPQPGTIVAWSRIHEAKAAIIVLNTHGLESRCAEITIDANLHGEGSTISLLYSGDWDDAKLRQLKSDQTLPVKRYPGGRTTFTIELPPAGMAILS